MVSTADGEETELLRGAGSGKILRPSPSRPGTPTPILTTSNDVPTPSTPSPLTATLITKTSGTPPGNQHQVPGTPGSTSSEASCQFLQEMASFRESSQRINRGSIPGSDRGKQNKNNSILRNILFLIVAEVCKAPKSSKFLNFIWFLLNVEFEKKT